MTNDRTFIVDQNLPTMVAINFVPMLLISYLWHQLEKP